MYLFTFATFIHEFAQHAPEIHAHFKNNMDVFLSDFSKIPSISVDYGLSEKSDKVVVYEGDFGWSDIGSFNSLRDVQKTILRCDILVSILRMFLFIVGMTK